jgi:ABC-type Fe3+ transport system substrate-binding protein
MLSTFKAKYGLTVNELNPDAGSADELEAIRANKDSKGPQAPDVIDIGVGHTATAMADGLLAKYKVADWDTIEMKDPDGYWWAEYYGVLVFEVVKPDIAESPKDWEDLLKPEYKGKVAMAGDVLKSNQSVQTVLAAGLSRTGGDIEAAPEAGLQFWKEMVAQATSSRSSLIRDASPSVRPDRHGMGLPGPGQPGCPGGQPGARDHRPRDGVWLDRTPAASAPTPRIRMRPACGGNSS